METVKELRKKHNTVTPRDLYIHYVFNQDPSQMIVPYEKWKNVIFEVMRRISEAIIRKNLILTLPYSLGTVGIERARAASKRKVDFHTTKLLGKVVYHHNLHTDGSVFRFSWRRKQAQMRSNKNMAIYKWTPIRGEKTTIGVRGLAMWIKQCANDPYIKDYDAPYRF